MWRYHAQAAVASEAIELLAVADLREEVAREVAEKRGVKRVYGDAESLLADGDLDAVVLAMPAHIRTRLACKAFDAGKHVLTEKPVAMNSAEVEELIRARVELLAACCCLRYQFFEATAKDVVASGVLGKLRVVHCRAIRAAAGPPPQSPPPPWRLKRSLNAGGIMSNWGCYDLDYLLGIAGWSLVPKQVLAQIWTVPAAYAHYAAPDSDAETHVAVLIRCQDDVMISYERAEFIAAREGSTWELIADEGALSLHMTPSEDGRVVYFKADNTKGVVSETVCTADEDIMKAHAGPIEELATAIEEGRSPQATLERAWVIQQITDAIYESAGCRGSVDI